MRKCAIILLIYFVMAFSATSQIVDITQKITNISLPLLSHKDSIANLIPVIDGLVISGDDTLNLKDSFGRLLLGFGYDKAKFSTYYLNSSKVNSEIHVTLHFCYDRLLEIAIMADGRKKLKEIKSAVNENFKITQRADEFDLVKDSMGGPSFVVVKGEICNYFGKNRHTNFSYFEYISDEKAFLKLRDKKGFDKMPSWCGTCNRYGNRSWAKVKKYLRKNQPRVK